MILLDTNVIIDLFGSDAGAEASWSRRAYARAVEHGSVCCNHVVLAELVGQADLPDRVIDMLDLWQIEIAELSVPAAFGAGRAFAAYRRRGGERRAILADFLIGGHAAALGASLMTRDRRLAGYFPDLPLITPETHP